MLSTHAAERIVVFCSSVCVLDIQLEDSVSVNAGLTASLSTVCWFDTHSVLKSRITSVIPHKGVS